MPIFAPEHKSGGLKIATDRHTTVTASDTVDTGLSQVIAAFATLKSAPVLLGSMVAADEGNQAGAPRAGSILIKTYRATAVGDTTPVPASGAGLGLTVTWIAFGY